jgi:hypothetical protein
MSIAEWVRQVLDLARRREPTEDLGKELNAIRAETKYEFLVSDIHQMLADIEQGYKNNDQP